MDFVAGLHEPNSARCDSPTGSESTVTGNSTLSQVAPSPSPAASTSTVSGTVPGFQSTETPEPDTSTPEPQLNETKQFFEGVNPSTSQSPSTSASATHPVRAETLEPPPIPSIEAELDEMMNTINGMGKNIGNFWGGFRKQGLSALQTSRKNLELYTDTARKDLRPFVEKARTEIDRLGEQAKVTLSETRDTVAVDDDDQNDQPEEQSDEGSSESAQHPKPAPKRTHARAPSSSFYGEVYTSPDSTTDLDDKQVSQVHEQQPSTSSPPGQSDAFPIFSRLQTQLDTAFITRNWRPNFQNLQTQLHKFEGQGQKLAEDYYQRSEGYFKGASELLRDAVKLVPPEESTADASTPSSASKVENQRSIKGAVALTAGRKEALLARLRSDAPAVLVIDPDEQLVTTASEPTSVATEKEDRKANDDTSRAFNEFKEKTQSEGGMDGDVWQQNIKEELALQSEGIAGLKKGLETLVPDTISADEFWLRYFFRKRQIELDEAKRKQILEEASRQAEKEDEDEEFNWDMGDDDDDDDQDKGKLREDTESTIKVSSSQEASKMSHTSTTSPRNSSEEGTMSSFDVVSSIDQDEGKRKNATDEGLKQGGGGGPGARDSDDDSDWE